ncbi:MAG: metallophosphoesterase family protein, partial [Solirubrobacteraceae bacterium]
MRIAVLSDIHGNRPAFEAVLADVDAAGLETIWCLGDLVGYGAEPDACVELARSHTDICLVGNHDMAVRGDLSLDEFSRGAELAARWTQDTMAAGNIG